MRPFVAGLASELTKLSAKEQDRGALQSIAPLLAGLGAASLAYGLSRKQRLSESPVMQAIQKASKGRLTILDTLEKGDVPSLLGRMLKRVARGADDVVEIPYSRWSRDAEGLPYRSAKLPGAKKIEGAVMAQAHDPIVARRFRGDVEVGEDVATIKRLENKLTESRVLRRYVPEAFPRSEQLALAGGRGPENRLRALQERLRNRYPHGYVIKPIDEAATGGVITHDHDLVELLHGKDRPMYGRWTKQLLKDPEEFMVQEHISIAKDRALLSKREGKVMVGKTVPAEYRVHAIGGQVVPGATHHRWAISSEINPFSSLAPEISRVNKATQVHLSKIPRNKLPNLPMALDVVRDTKGAYKIIETNPGGGSAFLAPEQSGIPTLTGHMHYKAITGRDSPALATAKGMLAGTSAGLVTRKMLTRGESSPDERTGSSA
jgi:hypothetical protein